MRDPGSDDLNLITDRRQHVLELLTERNFVVDDEDAASHYKPLLRALERKEVPVLATEATPVLEVLQQEDAPGTSASSEAVIPDFARMQSAHSGRSSMISATRATLSSITSGR